MGIQVRVLWGALMRKKYTRYTKEVLVEAVCDSTSVAQVMKKLGHKSLNGGSHAHISRRIRHFNIDTSHFLGQGSNCGEGHSGGPAKLLPDEVLVYDRSNGYREKVVILRRALLESGVPYQCEKCGLGNEWEGAEITLDIDHINRDPLDNVRDNLRFLCPNCHSQREFVFTGMCSHSPGIVGQ